MSSKISKMFTPKRMIAGIGSVAVTGLIFTSTSGAGFTASDTGAVTVDTATVSLNLSDATNPTGNFDLKFENLVPGTELSDNFTVTNTGEVPVSVKIGPPVNVTSLDTTSADPSADALDATQLNQLSVAVDSYLPATQATSLPASVDLGSLGVGESRTYNVRVALASTADNSWMGVSASSTVTVTVES